MFSLIVGALLFVLGIVSSGGLDAAMNAPFLILIFLWIAVFLIPSWAVQVRRFHDQDRSGWFILLNFVPYIGGLIVLVMMALEGTKGPNRFGADPKVLLTLP